VYLDQTMVRSLGSSRDGVSIEGKRRAGRKPQGRSLYRLSLILPGRNTL
jgi:hypothetical protein